MAEGSSTADDQSPMPPSSRPAALSLLWSADRTQSHGSAAATYVLRKDRKPHRFRNRAGTSSGSESPSPRPEFPFRTARQRPAETRTASSATAHGPTRPAPREVLVRRAGRTPCPSMSTPTSSQSAPEFRREK